MDLIEFIGFVITILALLVIATRRTMEERRRRRDPEAYEKEQEEQRKALRQTLREMHIDLEDEDEEEEEEEEPTSPPPVQNIPKPRTQRIVYDNYHVEPRLAAYEPKNSIQDRQFKSAVEERENRPIHEVVSSDLHMDDTYEFKEVVDISVGEKILKEIPSIKQMVILHEILDRPKALRYEASGSIERSWE